MDSKPGERKSTSERIAWVISLLTISPFQIILYLAFAEVICNTFAEAAILNTISGAFYLLIPFIPLLYVTRKRKAQDYSIPIGDRFLILLIQIFGFIGASIVYFYYPSWTGINTDILFIFTVGYTILHVVCLIITSGWKFKISLHMTGAASAITGLVIVFGWWWVWLYLFCIPIGWSRVKLEAHSFAQVFWGTIVGGVTIFITYVGFGYVF